ncbi:tyrosine-type recombinase/integrase [Chryseobacterium sp. MP_3.2]|uniref:tyrosine-type recombinase/integrase n=1 Tax=Chryseobacterium sp. MP_3.2 TaxID=3071712 RepID=UPI002E043044|nr:integrase/recombinase XerD [Chryseobacterium sp. MP_3.2]
MKTRFYLHGYLNAEGTTQIFFSVTINKLRERIPTGYFVKPCNWDQTKQRAKTDDHINLVLENFCAKATQIKTFYFLTKKEVGMDNFLKEFFSETPSFDFNSFMIKEITERVNNANTLKKHKSVYKKLVDFAAVIPFTDIDFKFIEKYRQHLSRIGNAATTVNSNIKIIKHYLNIASKYGIVLNINLEMVKVGSLAGNRININIEQVRKLQAFFVSEFIKENHRLSLGYFLFACNTGLRIGDIEQLKRKELLEETFQFTTIKTNKIQKIQLNRTAKLLIETEPRLFIQFPKQQVLNRELKTIAAQCGIKTAIYMHVGRHTFATNFLRKGGSVQELQVLLGHSSIETTMQYVHIVEAEAIQSVFLLDD